MIIVRKKTRTTIELQRLNIVTARGSDGRKWPVKSRDRACCSLLSLPVLLIAALYLMPTGATGTQQQDAKLEVTPTATTGATQTAKPEQGQPDVGQLIGLAPASFQDQAELASQLVDLATAPQGRGDQELHDHQLTALEEASRAAALPSEALVENGNAVANATSTGMQADSSKQPPVYRSQPKHVENPAQITGRSSSEAAADDDLTTAAGKKKKSYKLKYHKVKKGKKKKKKLILVKSHKKKKHHHHHHVKHHHHHHHHKKPKKKYKVTMHKVKGKKKKKKKIIVVKKKHHHKKHKHASKKVKHVVKKTETKHQDAGHHHEPESHDEGGGGGGEAGSGGGHSHGHGKYYQYAEVPKKGAWKMGFKRGNEKHEVERKEEGHKSHFKTEFKWHDKKGKGQHIWDYNHHDKKHGYHHAAAASNEQPATQQTSADPNASPATGASEAGARVTHGEESGAASGQPTAASSGSDTSASQTTTRTSNEDHQPGSLMSTAETLQRDSSRIGADPSPSDNNNNNDGNNTQQLAGTQTTTTTKAG